MSSIEQTIVAINKKLDLLAKPKPFWVTPEFVMEKMGIDKVEMGRLRRLNPDWYKIKKSGGYMYDFNSIPVTMLKQPHKN